MTLISFESWPKIQVNGKCTQWPGSTNRTVFLLFSTAIHVVKHSYGTSSLVVNLPASLGRRLRSWKKDSGMSRAIAQAVSRRLPTAAARVRAGISSCRICGGQCGTGIGFLRVLRFPLPVRIPSIAPQSSSSGAGTVGQTMVAVSSGLSLT
jgi:hypothetical protein